MSLEKKKEGPRGASVGAIVNGAKVFDLKTEKKRKSGVSSEVEENSTVRRRILRSDVAKQREKEAEEAKKKALEKRVVVLALERCIREKNSIDRVISFKQLTVENKRVLRSSNGRKTGFSEPHAEKFAEEAAVREGNDGIEGSTCEEDIEAQQDIIAKSDVSKKSEKNGIEDKIAVDDDGSAVEIVTEDVALGTDHDQSRVLTAKDNDAEKINYEEEIVVEKDDVSRGMKGSVTQMKGSGEAFDSNKKHATEEVAPGSGNHGEGFNCTLSKRNGTDEINFDPANRTECKTHMELDVAEQMKFEDADEGLVRAESAYETGHEIERDVRNMIPKVKIRVENRRFTRSRTAKVIEDADANTDKQISTEKVSSEGDQNGNSCDIGNQTGTKIEEMMVDSDICEKNITRGKTEAGKRRDMISDVAKTWGKADSSNGRKKSMDSGLESKRSRDASDDIIDRKKTKTDLSSYKRDQTEELQERKKLMMGSTRSCILGSIETKPIKIQNDGSSVNRIKSNYNRGSKLEDTKVKWSKHLGQMTLKQLKQNAHLSASFSKDGFSNSHHIKTKVRGRPRGSGFLSTNKNMIVYEKSHNQMGMRKTSSKKQRFYEAGIGAEPLFPLKESKIVDASRDTKDVIYQEENTTQTRKEKEAELRKARMELRDQIKGMLLNAGWKIDLRPRNGTNYKDTVYVSPEGCTHWSIVKAYHAFEKEFSCENNNNGKLLSGKHRKSLKSSLPSFFAISEESLSILKHPISRRRTNKEIEKAEMNFGEGTKSKKQKKQNKSSKLRSSQKKGGMSKGSVKKSRNGAKGAFSPAGKKLHMGKYRKKQKGCALLVRSFNQDAETGVGVYVPYAWKRTILSWMIDLGIINENAAVKYMNRRHTKTLLKGEIRREGIHCRCCSKIFTVSDFEIHAGSKQCDPFQNILLEEDDTSLLQCQINAWKRQDESERRGFYSINTHGDDTNDDTCGICGDGGDLICCDGCPSTFHQSCLGTEMLPPGDWYCMNCSCRYCASNSGTIAQENGSTNSKLISCSQCEEKYHQMCIPEEDVVIVSPSRSCSSFCGQTCNEVFKKLRMLLGVKNYLDEGFSWTIVQRFDEDLPGAVCTLDRMAECNSKIAVALAVMDECFLPIIDQRSGFNLIHNVVYNCGSNFSRLNYNGFYTFVLERNDEIISVASLRIHGTRAAEMPFIGTRNIYRRQGMCRRLLNEIESVLRSLNIEKLIIPAISELKDTWTKVFGFKVMEISEKEEVRSINLLVFPGTGLLSKPLLEKDSEEHGNTADKVDLFESGSTIHHAHEVVNELVLPAIVEPERHVSDDVIVHHKLEVKDLEPILSASDILVEPYSDVSAKYCDAYVEFQALELKSSEDTAQKDQPVQLETISLDGSVTKTKLQNGSSSRLETKLTSGSSVR